MKLIGTTSDRGADCTRVKVYKDDHVQINEVLGGGSVISQSHSRLHFGLGKADIVDRIEVKWLGSESLRVPDKVKVNQQIEVCEGSPG